MSEISLKSSSTALIVIDLQYGLTVMPVAPRTFDEVVKRTAQLADAFRAKDLRSSGCAWTCITSATWSWTLR